MGKMNREDEVLLAGEEATCVFIERMLRSLSAAARSRSIHVGMARRTRSGSASHA
jgi:hypothetical protein